METDKTKTPIAATYCTPAKFRPEAEPVICTMVGNGQLPRYSSNTKRGELDLHSLYETYVKSCVVHGIVGSTLDDSPGDDGDIGARHDVDFINNPPSFQEFKQLNQSHVYRHLRDDEIELRDPASERPKSRHYGLDHTDDADFYQCEYLDRNQLFWYIVAANEKWGTYFDLFYIVDGHYSRWLRKERRWVERWMRPAMADGWMGPGCRPAIVMYSKFL